MTSPITFKCFTENLLYRMIFMVLKLPLDFAPPVLIFFSLSITISIISHSVFSLLHVPLSCLSLPPSLPPPHPFSLSHIISELLEKILPFCVQCSSALAIFHFTSFLLYFFHVIFGEKNHSV